MSVRSYSAVALVLLGASLAGAQQRGTMEFGAFGSAASFDQNLGLTNAIGGGGRIGMFLDPHWTIEFEDAEMKGNRPNGLNAVNVGILSGRLVAIPFKTGALSILVGVGAGVSTETNFLHSYGYDGLVGAKFALNDNVSFRVDGVLDWLECHTCKSYYRSVRMGFSVARHPGGSIRTVETVRTVEVPVAGPAFVQRADSVTAEEQARRRRAEADYRALRDSLNRNTNATAPAPASFSARATMEENIHFATDKADLTSEARGILDSKVAVFRANPSMRISIVGNTDARASDAHNMELGARRSAAAKAYLVAQGIDGSRIAISTVGERNLAVSGNSAAAEAQNRRDEFRLRISGEDPVAPKE